MSMNFLLKKLFCAGDVFAHCDIPCGIYTTDQVKTAAQTVKVMVEKIQSAGDDSHALARFIATKEQHAQLCKDELFILWGDFFKDEHMEKAPELHATMWRAVKLCSQNKREASMDLADQLCEAVQQVDVMFQRCQG